MNARKLSALRHKQNGMALMMLVFIVALAGVAGFLSYLDGSNVKIERDKKTAAALAEAKAALIGYMLKRQPKDGERVGDLPCPDKLTDGNYDGTQDSTCASSRLGRFPWSNVDYRGIFVDGLAQNLSDGVGERLWFVVSRNLVDPTNVPVIDKGILTPPPKYPWLSVYNSKGEILTSRAAALIVSPGVIIKNQNRAGNLPSASQFLDSVYVNGINFVNSSAVATKFITGEVFDSNKQLVSNDQIIFLTIDEVMPLIEAVNQKAKVP